MFRNPTSTPPLLSARFLEALTYAANLHAEQVRKGTDVPYVSHLVAVCSLVLEDGGNEDQAIAALLHDAIEDQPRQGKTAKEIGTILNLNHKTVEYHKSRLMKLWGVRSSNELVRSATELGIV